MIWNVAIIIVAVILAIIAFKFLVGIARTVVTVGLAILAIGLLWSLATGEDRLGMGPTAALIKDTTNSAVRTINHTTNGSVDMVVKLPEKSQYAPAPIDPESLAPQAGED